MSAASGASSSCGIAANSSQKDAQSAAEWGASYVKVSRDNIVSGDMFWRMVLACTSVGANAGRLELSARMSRRWRGGADEISQDGARHRQELPRPVLLRFGL